MLIPMNGPEKILEFYGLDPDDWYYMDKDMDNYYYVHKDTWQKICLRR